MKTVIHQKLSVGFIALSALSILYVSILAFIDPQKVMDLIQVQLTNTDAYSSIRGVYGGVGSMIVIMLIILAKNNIRLSLMMLVLLWGSYSISRLVTIFIEGPLGNFGKQWLVIESVFFLVALTLLLLQPASKKAS